MICRDVCKAAREGVDELEKFVRGRRGSDPRKVNLKRGSSIYDVCQISGFFTPSPNCPK